MKRYLIKKHCEATELLTISTGRVQDYYYGDTSVVRNISGDYLSRDNLPSNELIKMFGYKSAEDASEKLTDMRNKAEFTTTHNMWNITVELVEVDV